MPWTGPFNEVDLLRKTPNLNSTYHQSSSIILNNSKFHMAKLMAAKLTEIMYGLPSPIRITLSLHFSARVN